MKQKIYQGWSWPPFFNAQKNHSIPMNIMPTKLTKYHRSFFKKETILTAITIWMLNKILIKTERIKSNDVKIKDRTRFMNFFLFLTMLVWWGPFSILSISIFKKPPCHKKNLEASTQKKNFQENYPKWIYFFIIYP